MPPPQERTGILYAEGWGAPRPLAPVGSYDAGGPLGFRGAFLALASPVAARPVRLDGIDLSQLRARWPEIRAVMFTSYSLEDEIYAALEAGAWAYVRKGAARAELLQAIRTVHSGQRHIP